jgi:hypothetical protein
MRWFRALIVCCCLLMLLPRDVDATPPSQSFSCDAVALTSQFPWLQDWLAYLHVPYARQLPVAVEGQSLTLQICAPLNQSITADRLLGALTDALPRLSSAAGVPLGGGVKRPILLVADEQLPPSVSGQIDEAGIIRVRNASPERTIIHEGAHYWASEQNFADLWMIEGYADYLTEQVTGRPRMAILPEATCADVVLLRWEYDPPRTALCGYVRGAAVFRDLAATLGPERLRMALRELHVQSAPIHSWTMLVGLERASDRDLTPIFERYQVFPPEYDLQRRARQWGELRRLRGLAEPLGVALPPIADDIDARDYDAADRWLSRLPAFLEAAGAVAQRCEALALACDRPWLPLPRGNPAALELITARLAAAQPLLDRYRELRETAQAVDLAPPAGLTQAAAALDSLAEPQMRQALATLERGRALEQQCRDLAAPCPAGWRDQWRGGSIALAADDITKQTAVLSQSMQVERHCGTTPDACRAVWHPYLSARQFVEARAALGKLETLLNTAAGVERRCEDVAKICRDSWQIALRAEQLPGLERRLGGIDAMLVRAKQQEIDQSCSGWNCDLAWRAAFRQSADPQAALRLLDEAQVALPTLQRAAAAAPASHTDRSSIWPAASPAAPALIEQAHQAFERGDVVRARALAEQSLAAASAPRLNWIAAEMPFGITLTVALLVGVFAITLRRKPLPARRAAANQALLDELLSRPPEAKQRQTKKTKKAA